jgi:diguanylate cyclase (GGDEF)-like protein
MKSTFIRITLLFLLAITPAFLPEIKPFIPSYQRIATAYKIFFLMPYFLFGLVAILGLRLNQTRIFYTMILFTIFYFAVQKYDLEILPIISYDYFLRTLSVISILTFLFLFFFDEGALFGVSSFLRLVSIAFTLFISYIITTSGINIFHSVFYNQWITGFDGWVLPDIIWLVLIGTSIFLLIDKDKAIYSFKIGLVLVLITLVLAMNESIKVVDVTIDLRTYNAFAFSIIGVICLYSVYILYWQNVYIDELTSVPNRRAYNEDLKKLGRRYSIAMLDIDHFKKFNDTYGHKEGDNVLRYVAAHLKFSSRSKVFRYGGEEFSIIFPGYRAEEVRERLEYVCESLSERHFYIRMSDTKRSQKSEKDRGLDLSDHKQVKVTISIGVAQRTDKLKTPEDVIEAADKALYRAKKRGRNQVIVATKKSMGLDTTVF